MVMAMMGFRDMRMIVDERQVPMEMAMRLIGDAALMVHMVLVQVNVEVLVLDPVVDMEMAVMGMHQ
jgi:hypothetical protein